MTRNDPSDDWIDIDQLTRRRILYTGAAAGLAGLAGCSGDGGGGGGDGGDGGGGGGDGGDGGGGDGGGDGGGGGNTATPTPSPTPTPESVTLEAMSWGGDQEQSIVKAILKNYSNQHQNVTVKYTNTPFDQYSKKLQTQFSGKEEPDVFYLIADDAPKFMRQGALLNLNEYVKNDSEFNLDGIYDAMLDAFTYEDKIYGIPKDITSVGLFYNESHLEKAGVSAPKTWSDMRSAAEAVKSNTDVSFPMALGSRPRNTLVQLIWQNGGRVLSEDMSSAMVGEQPAIEALDFLNSMVEDDLAGLLGQDVKGTWGGPALGKEQTTMMMTGAWTIGTLKDKYSSVYKSTSVGLPTPKDGSKATIVFTTSWSASARTSSPEDAAGLIKSLTDKDGMWQWVSTGNALPARPALLERDFYNDRPLLKGLGDLGEFGRPFVFGPKSSKVLDALMGEAEACLTGDKAPDAAMKAAQRQINNAL